MKDLKKAFSFKGIEITREEFLSFDYPIDSSKKSDAEMLVMCKDVRSLMSSSKEEIKYAEKNKENLKDEVVLKVLEDKQSCMEILAVRNGWKYIEKDELQEVV